MTEPFKWFVNCNFEVAALTEVEAIGKVAAALYAAKLVTPDTPAAVTGWHITHATEEGEGG